LLNQLLNHDEEVLIGRRKKSFGTEMSLKGEGIK
jgi:hypothetical protein